MAGRRVRGLWTEVGLEAKVTTYLGTAILGEDGILTDRTGLSEARRSTFVVTGYYYVFITTSSPQHAPKTLATQYPDLSRIQLRVLERLDVCRWRWRRCSQKRNQEQAGERHPYCSTPA